MAGRKARKIPVVRGEMQSPVVIAPESIEALVQGMVASLPAAVGAAVDNRLQGRKLLREISGTLNRMTGTLNRMNEELSTKLDAVIEKLDASSREHAEILQATRKS